MIFSFLLVISHLSQIYTKPKTINHPFAQKELSLLYSLPPDVAKLEAMSFIFSRASPWPLVSGSLLKAELDIEADPENWLNFCLIWTLLRLY